MKNKKRGTVIVSVLFAVLCLAQTASAFYAPNLQRWVNRDPIGERGGMNLFGFVANNPASHMDPDGRQYVASGWRDELAIKIASLCACKNMILKVTHDAEEWANSNWSVMGATHNNEGSLADMLTHCVASCELAKQQAVCDIAGYDVRKEWQVREGTHTRGGDRMDYENNRVGFAIADTAGMDCKAGCLAAFRDGWLWTMDKTPPFRAHPVGGRKSLSALPPKP